MPSKASSSPPEPQPRPRVGGSFTLNKATGEWEPTPVEPSLEPGTDPEPTSSSDGTD